MKDKEIEKAKMPTIAEIKNRVVNNSGYVYDLDFVHDFGIDELINRVAKAYACEVLDYAAEKMTITHHDGHTKFNNDSITYYQIGADNLQPCKSSILNIKEEIK